MSQSLYLKNLGKKVIINPKQAEARQQKITETNKIQSIKMENKLFFENINNIYRL